MRVSPRSLVSLGPQGTFPTIIPVVDYGRQGLCASLEAQLLYTILLAFDSLICSIETVTG